MTSIAQVAEVLQVILGEVAQQAGQTSGFVQRASKLGGAELTQTLVLGWLANPHASLEELAQTAGALDVTISAQGLDQRLGEAAAVCLQQVLAAAVQQVVAARPVALSVWQRFRGVYVQDSTTISLPAALAAIWAGCGGGVANGPGTAALKVLVRWELQTGRLAAVALHPGRMADMTAGKQLPDLPRGALGLSDLGYFSLDWLGAQSEQGSFWLSRVPAGTRLVVDEQCWVMSEWLTTHGAANRVDQPVRLGAADQLPCRLLAVRVPLEVAQQRRRRMRAEARRSGVPVSQERLALAEWTVYVTNVPANQLSLDAAWVLARVRWQIELLFKLWKSHGQIDDWRSAKPWRILCEVYAKLLGQLVQHWILLVSCWDCPDRSLVKAAQIIRQHARHLASTFGQADELIRALTGVQRCLAHVGRLNKRRAAPSSAQLLTAFDASPALA